MHQQRHPEITDFRLLIMGEQDVLGFDVSMNNSFSMGEIKYLGALKNQAGHICYRK